MIIKAMQVHAFKIPDSMTFLNICHLHPWAYACSNYGFLMVVDSKRGKTSKSKRSKDYSALQASKTISRIYNN